MRTPYQIATQAREYIEDGWVQESWLDLKSGAVCALGAIGLAACGDPLDGYEKAMPVTLAVADEIGPTDESELHDRITCWNDEEGRTQQEVLALFDRVIERLDPQAGLDGPARIYEAEPVKTTPAPQEAPSEPETPAEPVETPEKEPVPA